VSGPAPALAQVRLAVRAALEPLAPGELVLVACSGGADSLALAAATAFEAPRAGLRAGAVTVDHGLQGGSNEHAECVAETLRGLGLGPVEVAKVAVGSEGGPEAAARAARYAGLDEAADRLEAAAILLGHTLDDQAETVLFRLLRGSGTADPRYGGPAGTAEWSELGGTGRPPLEADGGTGTAEAHWAEATFGPELMTGWIEGSAAMPLSRMSIAALADLGYRVDLSTADAFTLPALLRAAPGAAPTALPGTVEMLRPIGTIPGP